MNSSYTYASARVKALEHTLLSETHIERLLSAKTVPEAFKVLQDTFLAPYLAEHEDTNINEALNAEIAKTKILITSIAPEPAIFQVLWLKYDFQNLKTIIKGRRAKHSDDEILELCFQAGVYTPEYLLSVFDRDSLNLLNQSLYTVAKKAQDVKEVFEIDIIANLEYFIAIKRISEELPDEFIKDFIALLIDLFNLKTALRLQKISKHISIGNVFVTGGTFRKKDLENEKQILESFLKRGGEKVWASAIADFKNTGNYSLLEKVSDEYLAEFVKERSIYLDSPAPMFAYFTAKKNNVQLINGILTEKEAGLKEGEIRHIFRRVYA